MNNKIEFPYSWDYLALSEIHDTSKIPTINTQKFPDEIFEYYSIPAYQQGEAPILEKGHNINSNKLLLSAGTILFGKLNPRVEKVWTVKNHSNYRKIGSTEWIPICPEKGVDSNFIFFVLWSEFVMPLAKQNVSGSTPSRQRVDPTSFYKFKIPLPPLAEQQRIARLLSIVQDAITQQEQLIALTTELKKSLMHKLFTEGIYNEPQRKTEIGVIPESWDVQKLGQIAKLKSGGTPSREKSEYWNSGSIPWVKTTEINYKLIKETEEYITQEGLDNSSANIFPKGTLLMAMYGQGVTRGRVAILDIDASTNQACVAITPNSDKEIYIKFIYYYFTYHYENLRQLGHGANQSNLSATILKGFPIAFPKPESQIQISETLEKVDIKLEQHQQKRNCLTGLFRTLHHQLMTAQIRVDDLNLSALNLEAKGGEE